MRLVITIIFFITKVSLYVRARCFTDGRSFASVISRYLFSFFFFVSVHSWNKTATAAVDVDFFLLYAFFLSFRRLFIYCYRFVLISRRARPNNNAARARLLARSQSASHDRRATMPACSPRALMKRNNVRVSWMPKTNVVSSVGWKSDYLSPSTPPSHDGSFQNLL